MSSVLTLMAVAIACGGDETKMESVQARDLVPRAAKPPPVMEAGSEAEQIFSTRCKTCHGEVGAGDGPASMGLSPTPRNFQDVAWQQEVSDEHIANIILFGGAAVGRSPTMPRNPDLSAKPEAVEALVGYVRALGPG